MKSNVAFASDQSNTSSKLTKWKNEPTVLAMQDDLAVAQPSHDAHVGKVQEWLDLRNVAGKAKPKTGKNRSTVQPKLVRRQNEWRYSALTEPFLSNEKMFNVSPTTWEDTEKADQNQLVLNWQFRTKMNAISFIDEMVRTTVDEGTCAIRVGWKRETTKVMVEKPIYQFLSVVDPNYIQQLQQAIQLKDENPRGFNELPDELREAALYSLEVDQPVMAQVIGTQPVEEEKVIKNQPTLDILHYENLYLDPSCEGDVSKAGFAILSFETSKAELLKDGRYKNLKNINWSSQTPLNQPDHAAMSDDTTQFKDDLRKRVVAYEYWGWYDIHDNETLVPIVCTWIGNTMIRMEENPYPDQKLPIVLIPYLPIKKSATGEPDAELLGENQAIIGAVTRGMIDLMGRSANSQTGFAKGMLDPVNRSRYNSGADYEFNPGQNPAHGIVNHTYPEIPQSAITMLTLQNQEAEALSGVKAFSGGLSGEGYGEVAAGIRGMLDASSKREMAILRRMAKGMEEVGQKVISMNAVFLTEEETVRVTNDQFVTVNREDLGGKFDLKVDISTAEVDQAKAQDLAFMLQTMGNNMDFSMVQLILTEIARLKRMPELAHKIESFQPQPDPLEQQRKQLELAKLQAEIDEIRSKEALNQAKARRELAGADTSDLNFVEQETGTTHARDMQKLGAQAKANQDLEITKRLLEPDEAGTKKKDVISAAGYRDYSAQLTS